MLVLAALLTACNTVDFYQPQPLNGERLSAIPQELQGVWKVPEGERIEYTAEYFREEHFQKDSLGTVIDTTWQYTYLSDSIQLFRGEKYFVFNAQNDEGYWNFIVHRLEKNGAIGLYYCDDYTVYGKMKGLIMDSVFLNSQYYVDDLDEFAYKDTVLIHPTIKEIDALEYDNIDDVLVSGQIRIKDLKKVCRKEYLICRLLPDGTIYYPPNENEGEFDEE